MTDSRQAPSRSKKGHARSDSKRKSKLLLTFTPADLAAFPDIPGVRYEIIDGDLQVSRDATQFRFTSADLDRLPEFLGVRYEIIDGDLSVARQPQLRHQFTAGEICYALEGWNKETGIGFSFQVPGLVFSREEEVIPDVVWIRRARLAEATDEKGHLRLAPDLVVEVLSPGRVNERRDREVKLALYSRRGAQEYWIVDWEARLVDVYRRGQEGLQLAVTLRGEDVLTSPLLPGFSCPVANLWMPSL